jgi:MFS family permease
MTLALSSGVSGFIFARIKRFQKLMWAAWSLVVIGTALLSTLRPNSSPAQQYGYQIIGALGGGIILPGRVLSVQAAQKPEDVAMATTVVAFMLSMGQAFGIGVGGTIIQNRWDTLVNQALAARELIPKFKITSSDFEAAWKITSAFPAQYRQVYQDITAESMSTMFIFCASCAGVGLLTSLLSKDLSLDKDNRGRQRYLNPSTTVGNADAEPIQPTMSQLALIPVTWSPLSTNLDIESISESSWSQSVLSLTRPESVHL